MDWTHLYSFVTSLLFNYQMDVTLFQTYLDSAQAQIEGMRPWMILRANDASQTCGPSTTWQTQFNLGSTAQPFLKFFQTVTTPAVSLVDSNNNPYPLREVPYAQRYSYQTVQGVFCVDYVNKKLYIMGNLTQSYTIVQNYIYRPAKYDPTLENTWIFDNYDSTASQALGLLIALKWKGIDYDLINLQNATQLGNAANVIIDRLTAWDADLQANAQSGVDPFGTGTVGWQAGHLPGGIGPS